MKRHYYHQHKNNRRKKRTISLFFIDDHTRIQLVNDEDGDYINASKIVSLEEKKGTED